MSEPEGLGPMMQTHQGEPNFIERHRKAFGYGGIGVLAAAAIGGPTAYFLTRGGNSHNTIHSNPVATNSSDKAACMDFGFTGTNYDPVAYNFDAYLPKPTDVASANGASKYVLDLFGKNGVLSGKANQATLAAIEAAVVVPATSSDTKTDYDPTTVFESKLQAYESSNGKAAGQADCEQAHHVLVETVGYNPTFAQEGNTATLLARTTEGQYGVGMKLTHTAESHDLGGVEFKGRTSAHDLHGFTDTLIATTENDASQHGGELYYTGAYPLPTAKGTEQQGNHPTPTTSPKPTVTPSPEQNNQNNGGSNANNNGSNSPEKGKSGGSCNGCGQQNCPNCKKGGGGGTTSPTPGPGPSGPTGGKTPTPGPTPTGPGNTPTPGPSSSPSNSPSSSPSPSPTPSAPKSPAPSDCPGC